MTKMLMLLNSWQRMRNNSVNQWLKGSIPDEAFMKAIQYDYE